MGLIGAIIIGILAGFIANKIMGKGGGLLWNLGWQSQQPKMFRDHRRHALPSNY